MTVEPIVRATNTDQPRTASMHLPWLVVSVWLMGTAMAFWYFEMGQQRPFEILELAQFAPEVRALEAESWFKDEFLRHEATTSPRAAVTVVHVYRSDCACNRFTDPHLAKLQAQYGPSNVRFIRLEASQLRASGRLRWVDATPAALVFDAAGRLVYFGPYSDANWCGAAGGLVERILEKTLNGIPQKLQRVLSRGCFCGEKPSSATGAVI